MKELAMKQTETENRPWGSYTVLSDSPHNKVKRLEVLPGHRLSLQMHQQREEHWIVTQGLALVTIDAETFEAAVGTYIFIPKGAKHRLANPGNTLVELIEVQLGAYFGEDDIIRFEDDYKRASV